MIQIDQIQVYLISIHYSHNEIEKQKDDREYREINKIQYHHDRYLKLVPILFISENIAPPPRSANTSSDQMVPPATQGPKMVLDIIEKQIDFSRADKGLGLSIAGGLGSTPFKVQVIIQTMLQNQQSKQIDI